METQMFFHWDYLNEIVKKRYPRRADQTGVFIVELRNPDSAAEVSQAIDATFANSLAETLTETENAFELGFVSMSEAILLAIQAVSFVVIIIIMAVMANTMAMTARERSAEYATLKALGFGAGFVALLIFAESMLIALIGGLAGIALTFPLAECVSRPDRDAVSDLPDQRHDDRDPARRGRAGRRSSRRRCRRGARRASASSMACGLWCSGMAIPFTYIVRNLVARRLTTVLTAGGMALVVYVFATVLMLSAGLKATLVATGQDDNIIVIRRGAQTEVQSGIDRRQAGIVESLPDIAIGQNGERLISKEPVVLINLPKRASGKPSNVVIRGIAPTALALRPNVKIVEGRMFQPGTSEIITGRAIADGFRGAGVGETLRFASRDWTVVGVFDAERTGFDSEIWGDAEQFLQAFRRVGFSALLFKLADPERFDAVKEVIESDPRLTLEAKRETRFYADQSESLARFIFYPRHDDLDHLFHRRDHRCDDHHVRERRQPHRGDRHAARAGVLPRLDPDRVPGRIAVAGLARRRDRSRLRRVHADVVDLDDQLPDLRRDRFSLRADAGHRRLRAAVRAGDGIHRRLPAGGARRAAQDRRRAASRVILVPRFTDLDLPSPSSPPGNS